jgi:hypothetical protein
MRNRFNTALFAGQPDKTSNRTHGLNDPFEQTSKKISLSRICFREFFDLTNERTDLLPGLFNRPGIDSAHGAETFSGPRPTITPMPCV